MRVRIAPYLSADKDDAASEVVIKYYSPYLCAGAPNDVGKADDDSDGMPEFWQTELEKPADLSGCAILWQFDGKRYQYRVEGSADGRAWSVLSDQTKSTRIVQRHELKFDDARGIRFVRITVTGVEEGCWVGIREVKVFGQSRAGVER